MNELKIEYLAPEELTPYENNTRKKHHCRGPRAANCRDGDGAEESALHPARPSYRHAEKGIRNTSQQNGRIVCVGF